MKTELLLDHATILANQARPIHFALRFTADEVAVAVSLGPVSVLALVHCCTHLAKGPRTVEDFCRHLANYGIEIRAQEVPRSDLGQTLRNLGLVLDSPDAEGGMVLVSPFKTSIQGERR